MDELSGELGPHAGQPVVARGRPHPSGIDAVPTGGHWGLPRGFGALRTPASIRVAFPGPVRATLSEVPGRRRSRWPQSLAAVADKGAMSARR